MGRIGKPRVIDLFSGAGLFGLAFAMEGFRRVAAYDFDPWAIATHRHNSRTLAVQADLTKLLPEGRCEVLVAGPPCQGFSTIGARHSDDPRNSLSRIVPVWAASLKPRLVVVENVPSFLKSRAWNHITRRLEALGFECATFIVNARDFGVAQNRVRSITFYSRRTLPVTIGSRDPLRSTVAEAFAGLPAFPNARLGHTCRPQSEHSMRRIRQVPPGGDIRDINRKAPELVPKSWKSVQGKIVDIWGRLKWDGVSNTIRTGFLHPSRGRFLHPDEDRPISFREAARLQSIPDAFHFLGGAEATARQIGNAVPVNLGRAIARAAKEVI